MFLNKNSADYRLVNKTVGQRMSINGKPAVVTEVWSNGFEVSIMNRDGSSYTQWVSQSLND